MPWDCSSARPTPTLVSFDPTSQPALAPTFLLTLTGTDFYADSVVRWNGITLVTSVLSSTLAQAVVPSYLFQEGGDFPVTIFTPAPGGGESRRADVQYRIAKEGLFAYGSAQVNIFIPLCPPEDAMR